MECGWVCDVFVQLSQGDTYVGCLVMFSGGESNSCLLWVGCLWIVGLPIGGLSGLTESKVGAC